MALFIDGSTPAAATGNPTATTASFTPPAGSLLVVAFSGNTFTAADPSIPTVTDSLGAHLTYTLSDWQSHVDAPAVSGQCALWTAPVVTSTAMTVSVTNNDGSARHTALQVWVLTGQDSIDPLGAHGKNGSASASAIVQSYTAQGTNGQGFIVTCDWDTLGNETAGSGCTLDATGSPSGQFSYGAVRRTVPDDSVGSLTTLNVSLPGSSANLTWCYLEILEQVGDPPEKDPPPFVVSHPPGDGISPNGIWNPWLGTESAAPDDTGVRIDVSSPAVVVNTVAGTSALTTGSFTPPAGSVLLVLWAGNSFGGASPSQPTITDSLGVHLTYTLTDWQSHADAPAVNGQAAAWTAPVVTSAAMTVTVSNLDGSARQAEMQVLVITGAATNPVGAHGKGGSTSTKFLAQSYTPTVTGGQGFISVCDWDATGAPTPGTDCWIAHVGDLGTIAGTISYAQVKRTIPDDVASVSNRLNVSMANTSTNLAWVYVEIVPPAGAAPVWPAFFIPSRRAPRAPARRGRFSTPVPAQQVVAAPAYPPVGVRARLKVARWTRTHVAGPVPAQVPVAPTFVAVPMRARIKPYLGRHRANPTAPIDQDPVTQPQRVRVKPPAPRRRQPAQVPPDQLGVWLQGLRARVRGWRPVRGHSAGPVPAQVAPTAPAYPPQSVRTRLRVAKIWRARAAQPVPAQITVTPPAYVAQGLRARIRALRLSRGRAATPVPAQIVLTAPAYVPGRGRQVALRQAMLRRGRPVVPAAAQLVPPVVARLKLRQVTVRTRRRTSVVPPVQSSPPPLMTRLRLRLVRLVRGKTASIVPAQIILIAPPYPPQPVRSRARMFSRRRRTTGNGWLLVANICTTDRPGSGITARPSSGTTAYGLTTTTRPGSGITARPNTGTTSDPC